MRRPYLMVLILCGCTGHSDGDLGPLADLGAADSRAQDLAAAPDQTAGSPADLSSPVDLSASVDLSSSADLSESADLSKPTDLSIAGDLSEPADLFRPADLHAPPDLSKPSGTVLLLGGGGAAIVAGEFHPSTGWSTTALGDSSTDGLTLSAVGATVAIGAIRSTHNAGELRVTTFGSGGWSAFSPIAAGVTTQSAPAGASALGVAQLAFWGDDAKHYFAAHQSSWSPVAEPIGAPPNQSFGPSAPAIAALASGDTLVAFAGANGDLFDQTRQAAVWQTASGHGLGSVVTLTPAVVELGSGAPLIAFVRSSDQHILFTIRQAGVWSSPAAVDVNGYSNDAVALVALPDGGAALGFRGQDARVYASRYSPLGVWSVPVGVAGSTVTTPSVPALAVGVGGADVELAYADGSDLQAYHARQFGGVWSVPVAVGGSGVTHVALCAAP